MNTLFLLLILLSSTIHLTLNAATNAVPDSTRTERQARALNGMAAAQRRMLAALNLEDATAAEPEQITCPVCSWPFQAGAQGNDERIQCPHTAVNTIMPEGGRHYFHKGCVIGWGRRNPTCPTCRTPWPDIESDAHPLVVAVYENNFAAVHQLVQEGLGLNSADPEGDDTFFMQSLPYASHDMVRLMISLGADTARANNIGITPLMQAARHNNVAAVNVLLTAGADVNAVSATGDLVIHYAIFHMAIDALARLIAAHADVNAANSYLTTPLMLAVASAKIRPLVGLHMMDMLIAAGANLNPESTRQNPLAAALMFSTSAAVNKLLAAGANANTVDTETGITMLMVAAGLGRLDMVTALLAAGADPFVAIPATHQRSPGYTARMLAARKGHLATAARLWAAEEAAGWRRWWGQR